MHDPRSRTDYPVGTRVRVTHLVRVGSSRWSTSVEGRVVARSLRPVGGVEMGSRAIATTQATLRLELDDGEITELALDDWTQVEPIADHVPAPESKPEPASASAH